VKRAGVGRAAVERAAVRCAAPLSLALALAGCGDDKPKTDSAYPAANTALLALVPVYPGAAAPKTTAGGDASTQFGARDWTLPVRTDPEAVITWYVPRLQRAGWRVTGKSAGTIRAVRRHETLSLGVRGRTLEAVVNSRGA
jgi:hypothetical protein